jgi:hypothetical protein
MIGTLPITKTMPAQNGKLSNWSLASLKILNAARAAIAPLTKAAMVLLRCWCRRGRSVSEDYDADLLAAKIACVFIKRGLSPPFDLKPTARRWRDYPVDDVLAAIQQYFIHHRWRYSSGSGDQFFDFFRQQVQEACERNLPTLEKLKQPRPGVSTPRKKPKPKSNAPKVKQVPQRGGCVDSIVSSPTGLFDKYSDAIGDEVVNDPMEGYEAEGTPIGDGNDA